ncbi:MAG TPA: DUF4126 domain-containing protein [Hydrogenophaga sp.]|uniref:DUF4126 domain-containing protein n=1 Tax=Hydrogenophaga sp. TaxID=1904254 RepID=UPI0008CF7C81|nr:DUF4126 domain-containing protein [Hydrogenophaga sp.]OGA75748.1 MAG: hypothetical protein A2X73_16910 [Burkholderiales bacterium GWE1_65_30]OGA90270.1 MAG: hypothetical protein A2X72_06940 [Burkholderiales bacterium GWF1_66_17]HAX21574.1 DUF4126 domain-containing protein [Hydrogenophaga sp.]HBU19597.1 DUF4126 domain-containing protein [Hydrogenophaga sp.]
MDALWTTLVNWLHGLGLHAGTGVVNEVGGQVVEGVSAAASQLDMPSMLALAAALGWVSGFRLYAVVFLVGASGALGWMPLPEGLQVLQHPAMLITSGALLFVEFFADKIPGLDSLWDMVNSVIRIPAGAALAAGALGADGSTMALVGALLGGTLAASSQAAKTTTRAAINTSPEPFSNIAMSLVEDGLVVGAVWLATNHPLVFGVLLVIAVVLMWIVTWMLFKFLRAVFRRAQSLFSSATA